MRAYSKGKNYFQRSVAQCLSRNLSCDKDRPRRNPKDLGKTEKVGKYRILLDQMLGNGYSSKVYKGIEEGKELKRYAIKVIELRLFSSSCLRLFEREIEIHQKLRHDNIVRCYDVIRTKTHIYIVMDYCPHGDLASYIQQKKKLSEPAIVDIMNQIINGYKHIAKEGILHRDLKPANVLRNGKVWKIADFGFSVRSGSFVDDINVGTPLYMPLEALSRSYYSVKTDIFALGVILFELLHGRTPWQCDSEIELMKRLTKGEALKIEREITNPKIKQFILKSCDLSLEKRLTRKELEGFDFTFSYPGNTGKIAEDLFTPSYSYRVEEVQKQTDFISNNNGILLSYLNHCKFVYYMIEHIDCFLLPIQQKNTFLMVLLKYMLKVAKMLQDNRFTSQRLIKFDQYKAKDHFVLIKNQIEQSCAKYEKTYLDYIRHCDIKTIRDVNGRFREFTLGNSPLPKDFYGRLKNYLGEILKSSAEAVHSIINDPRQVQSLSEKLQALKNGLTLFRYVEGKAEGQSTNFSSDTLTDYSESKLQKVDFLSLRKQAKAI